MRELIFERSELLYDISNMAFVAADIREGELSPHTLHQTFDICAPGNVDRISRLLDFAFAEAGVILRHITIPPPRRDVQADILVYHDSYRLRLRVEAGLSESGVIHLKECLHEYMVASALYGWFAVTLPAAADIWKEQKNVARMALKAAGHRGGSVTQRRVPPI